MLKWRQARDFGDDPFDTSGSDTPRVVKLRSIAFEIACFFYSARVRAVGAHTLRVLRFMV
jgi:hypothetical protein